MSADPHAPALPHAGPPQASTALELRQQLLGQLTGAVAHEVNNLMGIVSNCRHLIATHPDAGGALARPLARIDRALDAGTALTRQLLRHAGAQDARPERVALGVFLDEWRRNARHLLGRGFEVDVDVAPATRPLHVDPLDLDLALTTLALDVRRSMRGRGGRLRIRAANADAAAGPGRAPGDGPGWVDLVVEHAGGDRPSEVAGFAPAPWLDAVDATAADLGLGAVQAFCAQAGGALRRHSATGRDAVLTLRLPAAAGAGAGGDGDGDGDGDGRAAFGQMGPWPEPSLAGAGALRGMRVLLVEDQPMLADATAHLLAAHGAQVVQRDRADTALEAIDAGLDIDVVLSDVVMPGRSDGLALAHALRARRPGLAVVLITAHARADLLDAPWPVLPKPCPPPRLLQTLRDAAAWRPATGDAPDATGVETAAAARPADPAPQD